MLRAVSKDQKKFKTNLDLQLEVIWERIPCLEKIQIMNSLARSYKVIISTTRINIVYLESQSMITKIILKLDEEDSFLIKFIETKFHRFSGIRSCLSDSYSLQHYSLDLIQVTQDLQKLLISTYIKDQVYLQQISFNILFCLKQPVRM